MEKTQINQNAILLALGIIQPCSIKESYDFFCSLIQDKSILPSEKRFTNEFGFLLNAGYIAKCRKNSDALFSLTNKGNESLPRRLRYFRDINRMFLLKKARAAMLKSLRLGAKGLDGASPSRCTSDENTEYSRPKVILAPSTHRTLRQNYFWPRVTEQFLVTGHSAPSVSVLKPKHLKYYSFKDIIVEDNISGLNNLSLLIGFSNSFLALMVRNKKRFYRTFTLPKKSGGSRTIHSPRVGLKIVQYWINDYILSSLKIHQNCFSFKKQTSIIDNASEHMNSRFIYNIDIVDFFGNINGGMIFKILENNNIDKGIAQAITRLVTYGVGIPQGAPTSPLISNAVLYDFDTEVFDHALSRSCKYSRYADDITISGNDINHVKDVILKAKTLLTSMGFKTNPKKDRLLSNRSCQVVTGLVVNEKVWPPRAYRKNVRAAFYNANKYPESNIEKLSELRGHLSYLSQFPIKESDIEFMNTVIAQIATLKNKPA
ncbi:MAG: reverse transcriptase domain-containing protein [Agitococcus sp.]|nr:reverse transcriptase domain-containing protein [Agitococcus sp.]